MRQVNHPGESENFTRSRDFKKAEEEFAHRTNLVEDLPIEGLIFPQLIRKEVGQRCYYCLMKTGYSVKFTSLDQYGKHILYNHEGYSIYVFDEDVK